MKDKAKIREDAARRCEKMAELGMLTAGLMHELRNPGAAAARAGSQLRDNLLRLQELSLRFSKEGKTPEQLACMHRLLEEALHSSPAPAMSSIEQTETEEAMAAWLAESGVENATKIAPALVAIGFAAKNLECARSSFDGSGFSDTLNWLEALVSSAAQVTAIEESIARISGLACSVRAFAQDDTQPPQAFDLHHSLQSTLTLLDHKLREKRISAVKCFSTTPCTVRARSGALSQIWTNLIDNAINAAPEGSRIEITTWNEAGKEKNPGWVAVSIQDNGKGIPPEVLPHIFEEFFTTRPQEMGNGLGLAIVQRLIQQKLHGSIEVDSRPGRTRFIVRLPQS